jgi:hypothetical protein
MQLALFHPDWRPENLPRIRDLVDQALNAFRRTPQTAEENWVNPVPIAYWKQDNPLLLATTSFMTQTHNVFRLRWMLKDASAEQRVSIAKALNDLALLKGTRVELKAKLAELQAGSDKLLADAAKDIDITLVEIPDSSLAMDWARLCREMGGRPVGGAGENARDSRGRPAADTEVRKCAFVSDCFLIDAADIGAVHSQSDRRP